ncbi:MAG: hypothetical protein JNM76_16995 [Betaproteobacteria bacterium]|nr:hypothetical protein [Betaproteobacteria bacterium]
MKQKFSLLIFPLCGMLNAAHAASIGPGKANPMNQSLPARGPAVVNVEFPVAFLPGDADKCTVQWVIDQLPGDIATVSKSAPVAARSINFTTAGKHVIALKGFSNPGATACQGTQGLEVQVTAAPAVTAPATISAPPSLGGGGTVTPPPSVAGGGTVTPPPSVTGGSTLKAPPSVTGVGTVTPPPSVTGGGTVTPPPSVTGGGAVTPPPSVTGGGAANITPPPSTMGMGAPKAPPSITNAPPSLGGALGPSSITAVKLVGMAPRPDSLDPLAIVVEGTGKSECSFKLTFGPANLGLKGDGGSTPMTLSKLPQQMNLTGENFLGFPKDGWKAGDYLMKVESNFPNGCVVTAQPLTINVKLASNLGGAASPAIASGYKPTVFTGLRVDKLPAQPTDPIYVTVLGSGSTKCNVAVDVEGAGNPQTNVNYGVVGLPAQLMLTSNNTIGKSAYPAGAFKLKLRGAQLNPCAGTADPVEVMPVGPAISQATGIAAMAQSMNVSGAATLSGLTVPANWYDKLNNAFSFELKGQSGKDCALEFELRHLPTGQVKKFEGSGYPIPSTGSESWHASTPMPVGPYQLSVKASKKPGSFACYVPVDVLPAKFELKADQAVAQAVHTLHNVRVQPSLVPAGAKLSTPILATVRAKSNVAPATGCEATLEVRRKLSQQVVRKTIQLFATGVGTDVVAEVDLQEMMKSEGGFQPGTSIVRAYPMPKSSNKLSLAGQKLEPCLGEAKDDLTITEKTLIRGFQAETKLAKFGSESVKHGDKRIETRFTPLVSGPSACRFTARVVQHEGLRFASTVAKDIDYQFEFTPGKPMKTWDFKVDVIDNPATGYISSVPMKIVIESTSADKQGGKGCDIRYEKSFAVGEFLYNGKYQYVQ